MIFRQIEEIKNGIKTQTRRVVKPGENPVWVRGSIYAVKKNGRRLHTIGASRAIVPKRGQPGLTTHRIRILSIRQERLQDITPEDAIAEGLVEVQGKVEPGQWNPLRWYRPDFENWHGYARGRHYISHTVDYTDPAIPPEQYADARVSGYRHLWESINKKAPYRWIDNPPVWVYTFQCQEQTS